MKVKLFTHTDLDGVGCAIIGKLAFPEIDIEYCDYENVNDKIKQYIETEGYINYNSTFITDISVNKDVAELIDKAFTLEHEFVLLDHHKTALWLNEYQWTDVRETYEDFKTSGTWMFYRNILLFYIPESHTRYNILENADSFVELVRQYDTWEWKTKYNNIIPKQVNDLMYIVGRDEFINNVLNHFKMMREFELKEEEYALLKRNQEKINSYIESKNESIIVKEINGYRAGIVFAERYSSELGNKLSEIHPELDFIAIINPSHSVSYRTIKNNIDLGIIAGIYGGGGHPKASGSPIDDNMRNKIMDLIFA